MKIKCSICKSEKHEEEFDFNASKNRFSTFCKECRKDKMKEHYRNNKKYYVDKAGNRRNELVLKHRTLLFDYLKTHPCVDCGEKDPIVLEFDHQRDKTHNVSHLVRSAQTWNEIQVEIEKCEVRCANCHRRKTCKQFGYYAYMAS